MEADQSPPQGGAHPAAAAPGGYWGSPLNSGRADAGSSPSARPGGEAARIGGSHLSRNTRAVELAEQSESSTWGSPDSMGAPSGGPSSGAGPGGSPWHPDAAFHTPGQRVARVQLEELGSPALAPRSLLAAALDQAQAPGPHARRALAFGDDPDACGPGAQPGADGAGAAGPAEAAPAAPAAQHGPFHPAGLALPLAALQLPAVAELLAGSPVASPHIDQRNTRDQVGPSSNTRRRSQGNIPDMPTPGGPPRLLPRPAPPRQGREAALGCTPHRCHRAAGASALRPVDARPPAPEESYMETWGSPRSDDMSAFDPTPAQPLAARAQHLALGSAASHHQARLNRWTPSPCWPARPGAARTCSRPARQPS